MPSVHRLCRQLSAKKTPVNPLLGSDGNLRYRAEDRAEIFADWLEQQCSPNPIKFPEHAAAVKLHLEEYFAAPLPPDEDSVVVSPGEVHREILRTKAKKAPGADRITNTALRRMPYKSVAALTRLYNGILRSGHFPTIWKTGRIIMLPKPGKDVRKPESYRPITLLNTMSKVFERLLLRHLAPHITPRDEQFGFRADHSTTLQLCRVTHLMSDCANRGLYLASIFLDMEKAFDKVWHEGLLYKLSTSTAPRRLIKIIESFLHNRRMVVAVEDSISSERPVRAGVPQGSCLSPVLYARYTDDIPLEGRAQLALYADDVAYFACSANVGTAAAYLRPTLEALPDWLDRWMLSVNVAKTQAMITKRHPPPPLRLRGQDVPWLPRVKYLGVHIDFRMTFTKHVDSNIAQVKMARAKLSPVLASHLPLRTKLAIYKLYIRSRLTYAAPSWFAYISEYQKKRLRAQQNICLRKIVKAPRYVRNATIARDLNMEDLDTFISRQATNLFHRADATNHPLVRGIAPLHARPPDKVTKPSPRNLITQPLPQ